MSAYREESVVRLTYELELEDLERAWRPRNAEMTRNPRLAAAATVALGGAVYVFTIPAPAAQIALVASAVLVGWIMLKARAAFTEEALFGATWESRRHVQVEADESLISFRDRVSETRLEWEVVVHWDETEDAFLVYSTPALFHLIPKHAFSSPEQMTTLRHLLTDRVRGGAEPEIAAVRRTEWIPSVLYYVIFILVIMTAIEAVARLTT